MPLSAIVAGTTALVAGVNQYKDFINGVITDQTLTLGYVGTNSERLLSGNTAILLNRGAVSTSSTGIGLQSGSGGSITQGFMLAPGSEDLIFGYDNGSSFTEQLRIKATQAQGVWLASTNAAPPSTSTWGSGLRLSLYGNPANDAAVYGFGIAASELWANVPSIATFAVRVGGLKSMQTNASGFMVFNSTGTLKWFVSTTNSNSDPGSPWLRTDGNILVINPKTSQDLYLMWDSMVSNVGTTHIGTNAYTTVKIGEGAGTLLCGPLSTSGAVTHASVGRVVFTGATTFNPGGGFGTTSSGVSLGVTINGTNYWIQLYT